MRDAFFSPKFSKCGRYFSPKKPMICTLFFVNFPMLKMGDNPNKQASLVSWLLVNPSAPELAVLRKANLIFQ